MLREGYFYFKKYTLGRNISTNLEYIYFVYNMGDKSI